MSSKLQVAIAITAVICIIAFSASFFTRPPAKTYKAGVAAGDTFTYSIKGIATKIDVNATIPESTADLNSTEWYRVEITDVNDSKVYFNATWRFFNETEIQVSGKVDIETGMDNSPDFWAIYASDLEVNDFARPLREVGDNINATLMRDYKDSFRETNYLSLPERMRYDADDPSRTVTEYISIYFDKESGMLVELRDSMLYTNPEVLVIFEWKIIDSTVWTIS